MIVTFLRFSAPVPVVRKKIKVAVGALNDIAQPAVNAFAFARSEPSFDAGYSVAVCFFLEFDPDKRPAF